MITKLIIIYTNLMLAQIHDIVTRKKAPPLHQKVFSLSKEVTPFLKGSFGPIYGKSIVISNPGSHIEIKRVYDSLAKNHPEAGNPYWLTRTWDLLSWQPIYVSFISIYALHSLPDIQNIGQSRLKGFITGYRFGTDAHKHGTPEELIPEAGKALLALAEFYREQINTWTRIRPGFTQHLLADHLLAALIKVQRHHTEFSNEYILEQAKLWLEACELPIRPLTSLKTDPETGMLKLVRTSCCLVYKCDSRKLCDDCPRHPDNKRQATKPAK